MTIRFIRPLSAPARLLLRSSTLVLSLVVVLGSCSPLADRVEPSEEKEIIRVTVQHIERRAGPSVAFVARVVPARSSFAAAVNSNDGADEHWTERLTDVLDDLSLTSCAPGRCDEGGQVAVTLQAPVVVGDSARVRWLEASSTTPKDLTLHEASLERLNSGWAVLRDSLVGSAELGGHKE